MKKLVSNLSFSLAANLVSMLVSVLIVLLIPGFWGEVPYGYYQLYLFYSSYVGFFHLGWVDGIYLRIGGVPYENLDRKLYASQFYLLTLYAVAVAAAVAAAGAFAADGGKRFVLLMFGVCIALYLPVTYFSYLFQATGRIKAYAGLLLTEKLVFSGLLALLFVLGDRSFQKLVLADLAGKAAALVLALYYAGDVITAGLCGRKRTLSEAWANLSAGVRLMSANVASLLIIGIVRFAIEAKWGVAVFGRVSLSISVSNLFITFVTAVSIVLFPALKQANGERRTELYLHIRNVLMPVLLFLLLFYCPAEALLGILLPAYKESLHYLALLLPVFVFECRMSLLVNTWLKVLRKETQILYGNLLAMALSFLVAGITVYGLESPDAAVAGITFLLWVRVTVEEAYLSRALRCSFRKEARMEAALSAIFMLTAWYLDRIPAMLLYALVYTVYFTRVRKPFLDGLAALRDEFR